jgi:hypothetical protein
VQTVIHETNAMLANMKPLLTPGTFVFCSTPHARLADRAAKFALCMFRENEGISLILDLDSAKRLGFSTDLPMRRIVLEVLSALDGFGLTSAVSAALTAAQIPCNMVAACHHDHVFVPFDLAQQAIAILQAVHETAAIQTR